MADMNQALWIMLKGLLVVFLVMSLIAGGTWLSGRVFMALDAREKERKKAEKDREIAEKERRKAEKARKKSEAAARAAEVASKDSPPASAQASAAEKAPKAAKTAAQEKARSDDGAATEGETKEEVAVNSEEKGAS